MKKTITLLLASTLVAAAEPDKEALMKDGQAAFPLCMACHGPDATGMKAGTMVMAPSLVKSEIATGDPEVFAAILLKGIKKEGTEYLQVMAPLEAALDDKKLAGVMTYVRNSFGNDASAVTVEQAAEFRAKYKDRKEPFSRAEIAEMAKKKAS